jgi:D-alanyl-D-alanine carboxypeptidase
MINVRRHAGLIITLIGLITTCSSHADQIDDYVRREMRRQHIPGLSLGVVKDGRIIKAKGYGLANVELNVPATKDTVYEIGSVTKVFTATAVMILVNDGKIGLDDRITNYLSGLPSSWTDITVRHLLAHTSGITNDYNMATNYIGRRIPLSPKAAIKSVAGSPLAFTPGAKKAYCNTGYYLLGLIIEKASGKSYGDFMKERMFIPLNMQSSRMNDLEAVITNRASGYVWYRGLLNARYLDMSWAYSAGGLVTSVADMAKWDAALYSDKLIPQSLLQQMWTVGGKDALGWGVAEGAPYGRFLNHSGQTPGFVACIERWIDQKLTIVVLANEQDVPSWDIVDGVSYFFCPV